PVAGARLQAGQAIPPAELEAFVDGMVRRAMAREHVAGAAVAVVQNGQVLLKKGYGFASLAPQRAVDPDRTLFRIGSISKTFTWIGVMKEVEAGRMRLDQPVNLYLPERLRVRDQGYDQPVRVLDLMDHAAGFEDRAFGELFLRDYDYVRPLELYLRRERPRRVRPPGQVASYSNYGAGLAGEAAAFTSGKPFERLMEEEIFLPLGMRHTTFRERRPEKGALPAPMPEALAADVAEGYRWRGGGFNQQPYEFIGQIAPAGSAASTASDMARYMLALLGGGQLGEATVFGPKTAQAFRTPILATPPGVNGWAHGFMVQPLPGGRTGYGHAGETLSFTANMVTAPELNLGIFVATNTASGASLSRDLPKAVVREFYAQPATFPQAGSPELIQDAKRFAGHYLGTRRRYGGLEGFVGLLSAGAQVSVTPEGRLVTSGVGGAKVWVADGPVEAGRFVAADGEARLAFKMQNGQAVSFQTGPNLQQFERASFWRSPGGLGLMAGLAAAASIVCLAGAMLRSRRELRENQVQSRAALVQNLQAGLWLIGMASFGVWTVKSLRDPSRLFFAWPGALLVTASACALVAGTLTIATMVALPAVWRGGRRVDSWPILRRAAFTLTVAIYLGFAILLARWGALAPWSG
ncbi:MAG TPA: serine hydrolase domain-containing protein, partial [Phenylobacterium sp.]|uniref:serine hydrolase domain-containing protein n=1 Tax=Phenylobacterium sp. TaxID=1871053 RepID=UPI002B49DE9F